jgi:HK97 family phage portal protein
MGDRVPLRSALRRWWSGDHAGASAANLIPSRGGGGTVAPVTNEAAMRHSAVWACLRLRADLLSSMTPDVYRRVGGVKVEVTKPPVLVQPDGVVDLAEWLYSSQIDLDRAGNFFGLVTARDAAGRPARIEMLALADITVRCRGSRITEVRVADEVFSEANGRLPMIWHERQFTVSGLPLGLSPVAHAAWSIQEAKGAQKFAVDWFAGGAIPRAELVNRGKTINPAEASIARDAFAAAVDGGGLFVHGSDWEYRPIQSVAAQSEFLAARQLSAVEIARFFGVPADMIDAAMSGSSITYASITQRNLQFLIMHLGPAVSRREGALSRLTPSPRFVRMNRDILLAMDASTRAATLQTRIESRTLTPDEARRIEDLPPLTPEQESEFARLFGGARSTPTEATA